MIVAKLIGGLGNQLFQYAAAYNLAAINNTDLKLDSSEFELYKLHKYSLHHFDFPQNFITTDELCGLKEIKEKHYHYDDNLISVGNDVVLSGYWQSERYFQETAKKLKESLKLKSDLSAKSLEISELIKQVNSVSLHIRRGDYVVGTYSDQILDQLDLAYYFQAIKELGKNEKDIIFFIFSDDHEWVKNNLNINFPVVYVDHNNSEACFEDLYLMSLCKHNIIANSSFSWWGAWFNKNNCKKIYAPKNWFNANVKNINDKDLIPPSWHKITSKSHS